MCVLRGYPALPSSSSQGSHGSALCASLDLGSPSAGVPAPGASGCTALGLETLAYGLAPAPAAPCAAHTRAHALFAADPGADPAGFIQGLDPGTCCEGTGMGTVFAGERRTALSKVRKECLCFVLMHPKLIGRFAMSRQHCCGTCQRLLVGDA